jgi:hypothetical protein
MGAMGLPVLLAVLQEDRDDLELLKGALEVLQLTVALPEAASAAGSRGGAAAQQQLQLQQLEVSAMPHQCCVKLTGVGWARKAAVYGFEEPISSAVC